MAGPSAGGPHLPGGYQVEWTQLLTSCYYFVSQFDSIDHIYTIFKYLKKKKKDLFSRDCAPHAHSWLCLGRRLLPRPFPSQHVEVRLQGTSSLHRFLAA